MNTALKLLLGLGAVKMDKADDGLESGGGDLDLDTGTPEIEEEEEQGGDDLDWLFDDGEKEPEPEKKEPEPEPEPEEEPEEEEPEPEPEPEPEKKPEDKKPEPEKKEEEEQPQQPSDEDMAARKEAYRADLEKKFAISEEDANLLVTAPEQVLPRLASNIATHIMEEVSNMQKMLVQSMPQIIQHTQMQQTGEQDAKNQFMTMHPDLGDMNGTDLDAAVTSFAPVIKKQFPNATPQERMQKLGDLIKATYGIQAKAPKAKQPKVPKPHTPAAPTQSGKTPAQVQLSPLEQEIDELLRSDD